MSGEAARRMGRGTLVFLAASPLALAAPLPKRYFTIPPATQPKNRFAFLNKYRILSQGSNFNFCRNYSLELTLESEVSKHRDFKDSLKNAQAQKFPQSRSQRYN